MAQDGAARVRCRDGVGRRGFGRASRGDPSWTARGSVDQRSCSRIEWLQKSAKRSPPAERSREGALGDGRRPGAARAPVFDETASGPGPVTRGDGDAAMLPDPPRVQEDVRGRVASPSRGRRHRWREVWRRGAVDRGPPGLRRATSVIGPLGGRRDGRGKDRSWSIAVKRSPTPMGSPGAQAESSDPEGARDESRLQRSVRRIFLVTTRVTSPATLASTTAWHDEDGVARGDPEGL